MIYRTLSKVDPDNKGPRDKPTGWDWTRGAEGKKNLSTPDRREFVTRAPRIVESDSSTVPAIARRSFAYEFIITPVFSIRARIITS